MEIFHLPLSTYWPTSWNEILSDPIHARWLYGYKIGVNYSAVFTYSITYWSVIGGLITVTSREVPSIHPATETSIFSAAGIMHCSQSAEQLHTSPAVPLDYAEKTSVWGMLREGLLLGRCTLSFIWLQQVEPSGLDETPEGEPWFSVTYLAGEEEALAQRKEKTLYTHK